MPTIFRQRQQQIKPAEKHDDDQKIQITEIYDKGIQTDLPIVGTEDSVVVVTAPPAATSATTTQLPDDKTPSDTKKNQLWNSVIIGITSWIAGSSWSFLITSSIDQISSKKIKYSILIIWCIFITLVFTMMVWYT